MKHRNDIDGLRAIAPDGALFHFDYGHMTLSAAQAVVDQMARPVSP